MSIKIGNIIADEKEFAPFKECLKQFEGYEYTTRHNIKRVHIVIGSGEDRVELVTVFSGIGKAAAAAAAAYLIAEGSDYIINSGLSGGISGVRIGDIAVGTQYQMTDFDLTAIGYEKGMLCDCESIFSANDILLKAFLKAIPYAKQGKLATGDIFVSSSDLKNELKTNFGVIACDMESAAIAYVCHRAEIPFLSFRRISDNADDAAYDNYSEMNDKEEETLYQITREFVDELIKQGEIFNRK